MPSVRLTLPSDPRAVPIAVGVADAFGAVRELAPADAANVAAVTRGLLAAVLLHCYPGDPDGTVELELDADLTTVTVAIHDWGRPIAALDPNALPPGLEELAGLVSDLRLVNLGADGKRTTAVLEIAAPAADAPPAEHALDLPPPTAPGAADVREHLVIRDLRADDLAEVEAVSQLLYANYGLTYGHPDFYTPRWLAAQVQSGAVLSTVAVHDGEIVGHHALLREEGWAAAESGVAVVHPAYRGLGIFDRLFTRTVERATDAGLPAMFGRAVTVHPYSQRSELAHGYREAALLLGMVPAKMTMAGIAEDGGVRTASLVSYRILRPTPRAVTLPSLYRDRLVATYAHLGLELTAPTADAALAGPPVSWTADAERATGTLRVAGWSPAAAERTVHGARALLRDHPDVVFADLDLHALADPDPAVDLLNSLGFSYAGLLPFGPGGHDLLRLQRVTAAAVEMRRIATASRFGAELKAEVLTDRERVDA
ncbi:MAG: hypothetical protein U0R70_01410 [Solirubrobacteraceae bacterium]